LIASAAWQIGDGNESDQAVFAKIFCEFKKQLDLDALMVAAESLGKKTGGWLDFDSLCS
jgi:hypothetical protein